MASIRVDTQDLYEIQRTISTFKGNKIVIVRATNDTLSGVRTQAVRNIAAKVTPSQAVIRSHFSFNNMSLANMSAEISCYGKPLGLLAYTARAVRGGVSVRVLKSNSRSTIKHAFIATMSSGHRGVYWRQFNDFRVGQNPNVRYGTLKGSKYALPIQELYGPSIAEIFDDAEIINPTLADAGVRLQSRIEHHTNRLLESAR